MPPPPTDPSENPRVLLSPSVRLPPPPYGEFSLDQRRDVYTQITERILASLEAGTVPWHQPWKAHVSLPRNFVTRRPYRGINVFLLLARGYQSPFWLTFSQAGQVGARIKSREKASPIICWKEINFEDEETEESKKVRFLKFYYVFNVAQCENLKDSPSLSDQLGTITKPAEILYLMPQCPPIKHGMRKSFYSPGEDEVGMPFPETFISEEEYYSTLFHELVHSTGHRSRLDRSTLGEKAGFGSDPYCKEELIAEMGAAFLCAQAGITERTVDNSAAYINGWLGKLKSDKKLVIQAASQAQLATEFILGARVDNLQTETPSPAVP